jgi:hypothetical protein
MRNYFLTGILAALALTSLPALAVDNGIYLGASVGQSGVEVDDIGFDGGNFDGDDTGFKAIAGWRFLDWLSVEANYVDLGAGDDVVDGETLEIDASGISLSALGFWPIGPVDLFARIGAINWDAEVTSADFGELASDDGTDLTYGVGAQFRVWGLSIRGEYERFDIEDADTIDMFSVGVTWTFF